MENQSVTIPFTYFIELQKKVQQRDRVYDYVSDNTLWMIEVKEIAKFVGAEIKKDEEE